MEDQEQVFEKIVLTNPEYMPDGGSIVYGVNAIIGGLFFSVGIETIIAVISIGTNSFPTTFLILQFFGLMFFIGGSIGFSIGVMKIRLKRDFWRDIILLENEIKIIGRSDLESKYFNPGEIERIQMGSYITKSLAGRNRIRKTYHLEMRIKPKNEKEITLRTVINRQHKEVIQKDKENFTKFIQSNYNIESMEIEHINRAKRVKLFFLSLIPPILTVGIILLLYYL